MTTLATFKVEVTPPVGHPLCAGWYGVAEGVTDPLYAGGIVICEPGQDRIVLCSVEWCEISNRSHLAWRKALASAVGTSPERVAVHCMHSHCTPFPDEYAHEFLSRQMKSVSIMDTAWSERTVARVARAAGHALRFLKPVTHLGLGKAKVDQVASNRRILGEDGKIKAIRWTKTRDPKVRAEPEGLIDPFLKTISFWNDDLKLAVLHYYAVHPTSYEDTWVTPDFTGLARARRDREDAGTPHFYFTECAGNITAGKYNDGARENREVLTERVYRAMLEAEEGARRVRAPDLEWRTADISLPPRPDMRSEELMTVARDGAQPVAVRSRAAIMLSYLERRELPIPISALHFGQEASLVHLPGEAFMEYQIFAQCQRPGSQVMVPAYGDCGPGYICMEESFDEGGYEPTDSFVAGESEHILKAAIAEVMR